MTVLLGVQLVAQLAVFAQAQAEPQFLEPSVVFLITLRLGGLQA